MVRPPLRKIFQKNLKALPITEFWIPPLGVAPKKRGARYTEAADDAAAAQFRRMKTFFHATSISNLISPRSRSANEMRTGTGLY